MRPFASLFVVASSVIAQAPVTALVGTVLDPKGQAAPDAVVTVSRCDGRLFRCLDLQLRNEWVEVARTRTDKAGRFGLQVPLGLALRVEVDLPPFARWISESIVTGEDQKVRLEAACAVAGRLVNTATGKGTPGALRAWHPQTQVQLFAGRTDAEGRFRFERLPSGPYTVDIEPDVAGQPDWLDGLLDPGETETVEWTCAEGSLLTGKVTDAATGEPIAGARIGEGWTFDKAVRSGADGTYTLRGFGGHGPVIAVHAEAPGYARRRIDCDLGETAPYTEDFALERGADVVGQLVDGSGRPIAKAYVAAVTTTGPEVPWLATRSDANGRFVCTGFPRRCDGVLMVRHAGHASVVYSLPRPAGDGQIDFGTVRLQTPLVVRGMLRDDAGSPAPGQLVSLRGVNADMTWLAPMPSTWGFLQLYCGERQVRTDQNGAFAFGDVAPGEYGVAIGSMTDAAPILEIVTVAAGKELPALQLTR